MTVVEKYASGAINNGWTNPANIIGAEDVVCAFSGTNGTTVDATFDFAIPGGAIIDTFEVDVKAITMGFNEQCTVQIWDGVQWWLVADVNEGIAHCSQTAWHGYKNKTAIIDTPAKVNGVKIRFWERTGGGVGDREAWTTYVDAVKCKCTYHIAEAVRSHSGILLNPGIMFKKRRLVLPRFLSRIRCRDSASA